MTMVGKNGPGVKRFPLLLQALLPKSLLKTISKTKPCHPQSLLKTQLSGASFPSGQHSIAELGDHAHDLEPNVFSTDLFRDTELRAECQSSSPTPDSHEHEVHCVRGQCGTSAKEGFGEVGVQHQEVSPPVFSTDLTSETESRSACQSSRAAPNDSACENAVVCGIKSASRNPQKTGIYQMMMSHLMTSTSQSLYRIQKAQGQS